MKLMLSILALGLLVAVGCAFEDMGEGPALNDGFGGRGDHFGDRGDGFGDHDRSHDFGRGYDHHDWLNPGGYYYYNYYNYWYPSYGYTYTYPVYYTTPAVFPTYTYYYDPVVYDPWYAANVYGWSGTTYYYSGSWSWGRSGGNYFF